MNNLVTVIVPVYNVEKYLDRCIRSIITQTYRDLEIILVDDGSTDNSGKISDDYALIDSRINVIHKENGGLSSARNRALDIAKGDYIAFVDSDDYIESTMIEGMMNNFISAEVDIVVCGYNVVNEEGEVVCKKTGAFEKLMSGEEMTKDILLDKFPYSFAWNKIYRKSLFLDVRYPEGRYYEDIPVTYKLAYRAKHIYIKNNCYYNYFLYRSGNTTSELSSKKAAFSYYCALMNSFEIRQFINDKAIYSEIDSIVSKGIQNWTKETLKNSVKNGYNEFIKYERLLSELYQANNMDLNHTGIILYLRERSKYSVKTILKKIIGRK